MVWHLKFNMFTLIFALLNIKSVDLVAQLVEQYTFNVWALGSSPSQITKPPIIGGFFMQKSIYTP